MVSASGLTTTNYAISGMQPSTDQEVRVRSN